MSEVEFNTDDVIKVAAALLEEHSYWDSGDYAKDECCCNYCSGRSPQWSIWSDIDKIVHELDCPVLIARDLLTGFKKEIK